jgi:hypothetical protein
MQLKQLIEQLDLTDLTQNADLSRETTGIYVGDLLSHVMTKAQKDQIWITVQVNINIVAVAALCDVACILIPEGISVGEDVLAKAKEENITILSGKDSAAELIVAHSRLL